MPGTPGDEFASFRAWIAEVDSYGVYQEKGYELWAHAAFDYGLSPEDFVDVYTQAQMEGWTRDPHGSFAFMLEYIGIRNESLAKEDVAPGDTSHT